MLLGSCTFFEVTNFIEVSRPLLRNEHVFPRNYCYSNILRFSNKYTIFLRTCIYRNLIKVTKSKCEFK